jgi:hypothetical protein
MYKEEEEGRQEEEEEDYKFNHINSQTTLLLSQL